VPRKTITELTAIPDAKILDVSEFVFDAGRDFRRASFETHHAGESSADALARLTAQEGQPIDAAVCARALDAMRAEGWFIKHVRGLPLRG